MIEINAAALKKYTEGNFYPQYSKTVDIQNHLEFHFDGFDFFDNFTSEDLLKGENSHADFFRSYHMSKGRRIDVNPYYFRIVDLNRPNEDALIKKYRRATYKPITKRMCSKVVNTLRKIPRSKDWRINYSDSDKPEKLEDGEELETYTEEKYPFFRSVTNWLYQFGLRKMIIDPNGLFVVLPTNLHEKNDAILLKPFASYVSSKDVYDFVEGEHVVYRSDKTHVWLDKDNNPHEDFIIVLINTEAEETKVWEGKKTAIDKWELELVITHKIPLPVIRSGGEVNEVINNTIIYKSFIDDMLPSLDKAARTSSDLDAETVQHVYSQMWHFSGQECTNCRGAGLVKQGGETVKCTAKGCADGRMTHSPFSDIVVDRPKIGDAAAIPTPPAGYIQKNTEIAKTLKEFITSDIDDSLDAVNMLFLSKTPLAESGIAKAFDRDDSDNFVFGVSTHTVSVLKKIYNFINMWRNGFLTENEEDLRKLLPVINTPQKFDFINNAILAKELDEAMKAGVNPTLTNKIQVALSATSFPNDPNTTKTLDVVLKQDPLPGKTVDEKISMVVSGDIKEQDFLLSIYINDLVNIALSQNEDFLEKDFQDQRTILLTLTKEKESEKPSDKIILPIDGEDA